MSINIPLIKFVGDDILNRIHHETVSVLKSVGVVFESDEIIEVFKYHGVKTEGKKVFISEMEIETALKTCPRNFKMVGRRDAATVLVGEGQPQILVSPGNGTLFIQDLEGNRREATLGDFNMITQLCEQSPYVHLVGAVPVEPIDLPTRGRPAKLVYHLMQYSTKPLIGVAATKEEAKQVFDIIEIAFGCNGFLNNHVAIAYSVNPASPLRFEPLSCETMIAYAQRGQALFILPGLMAGISGPLDLFGLVVLSNAEILAALVFTQFINPGTPLVYSSGTFMVNMKNFYTITASPQGNIVNVVGLQMARQYYGLPCRTMAGMTDSKKVDYQAGSETMQNLTLYSLAGANIINECLGVMDSIMVTSFEKWILDEELLERVFCLEKGFEQMTSSTALENIKSIGCGGNYIMHSNTIANFRKVWMPAISDWNPYEVWKKRGGTDILQKAHQRFNQRMEATTGKALAPEYDRDISRYLDK